MLSLFVSCITLNYNTEIPPSTQLTPRQPRHIRPGLILQRVGTDVVRAADPAVARAGFLGLVSGEGAVAVAGEEVEAGAEVDAVAEAVDVGFG